MGSERLPGTVLTDRIETVRSTAEEDGILVDEDEETLDLVHVSGRVYDRAVPAPLQPYLARAATTGWRMLVPGARAIDLPVEFDFMAVSSYGSATKTSGVVRIVKDLDIDLTGRDVLIVDTAGRLQNKQGLMDELLKVIRVVKKVDPARHCVVTVDGRELTCGQRVNDLLYDSAALREARQADRRNLESAALLDSTALSQGPAPGGQAPAAGDVLHRGIRTQEGAAPPGAYTCC